MASLLRGADSGDQGGKRDPNSLLRNATARADASNVDTGVEQGGSFIDQAKHVGGGGLLTALDWLNRPSQGVLRGIQAQQTHQGLGGILRGVARGFQGSENGFSWRSDDTTNLRGALNTDDFMVDGGRGGINPDAEHAAENRGGRLAGAFDLLGTAVLDPLTYVTLGTGAVAKAGAKIGSEQLLKEGSTELAEKVATNAGKRKIKDVLSSDELDTLRKALASSEAGQAAKKGGEKFADDTIRDLNKTAGLRVAGQTVLKAETLRPAAETARLIGKTDDAGQVIARGLNNVVKDSRIVEATNRAVKPRYDLARQFGQDVADKVGRLGRASQAGEAIQTTETIGRLNRAVKASNVTDDELRNVFTPARDGGKLLDLADDFARQGDEGRAALARELHAMPTSTSTARILENATETAVKATKSAEELNLARRAKSVAGRQVSQIRNDIRATTQEIESYRPRPGFRSVNYGTQRKAAEAKLKDLQGQLRRAEREAVTTTGRAIRAAEGATRASSRATDADRIAVEVTAAGKRVIRDRSGELARKLDISVQAVNQIARSGSLPTGITREAFESAAQAVSRSSKEMIEKNTLKASALSTQRAYADQARDNLFRGLADIKDSTGNSLMSTTAKSGYDAVNLSDGSKIFVPAEIKKEFSRVESIINNDESIRAFERAIDGWQKWWRATATVPVIGGFGFHLRNAQGNVFNNFLAGVKDPKVYVQAGKLQKAIEKATASKKSFADAIRQQGLSDREVKIIEEARERGTIGDFLVQADQEIDPLVREVSRGKRALQGLNPLDRNKSYLIRSGTYIGRQVETNARLAHFIDKVNKTGSFEQADESVRKFLFDYADLTPIEQKVFRRYVPFYTYLRKNTPLQFEQLFTQPGKYSAIANLYNQASLNAGDTEGQDIPRYLLESGAIPLTGGDSPMMLSVDTPFSAAIRAVQPAINVAGLVGGKKNPLRPEGGRGEAARSLVGQAGGGPVELAKFALGQATGKDLFTGADISDETTAETANRLAKAISPLYGKVASAKKDAQSDEKGDKISRLVDAISGANATALTDKRSQGETYRKLDIVSKAIAAAKADGVDVPSATELQEAGVLPKPVKAKKATTRKTKVKKQKTPKAKAAAKAKKARTVKPKKPPTS